MIIKVKKGTYSYKTHIITIPDITITPGSIIGLSGESGCGKTTIGKILTGQLDYPKDKLYSPTLKRGKPNPIQWIGQQCEFAFNPLWTIERSLKEAFYQYSYYRLFDIFDLDICLQYRKPAELSGGQLQRFNLMRALVPTTKFIICDETTDQLDTITQKNIWDSLLREVNQRQIGVLVISHQTKLLEAVCDHIIMIPPIRSE
ncbi:ATP-binding cassette domain-containing protein [Vibrio harveyi]